MSDSPQNVIYSDIKKVFKWVILVAITIVIITIAGFMFVLAKDHFTAESREAAIFGKAIPFASSHTPWVYTRDDFGVESKLSLWFIGDTDQHAIIKVDDKYSVYSTITDKFGSINFNLEAGDVCGYASAYLKDGSVAGVQCDGKSYSGGPWNKFR